MIAYDTDLSVATSPTIMEPNLISTKSSYPTLIRWILPVVGATLAIVVLFWLYQDLDLERCLSAIAHADLIWIIVLGGTILLEQLTKGVELKHCDK